MSSIARSALRHYLQHKCRPKGGATFASHDLAYSTNFTSGRFVSTCKRCGWTRSINPKVEAP